MNEFTRKGMQLAEKMMRDSWATGDDAAWQPARSALLAHLEGGEQKWLLIETAPKDGTSVLLGRFAPGKDRDGLQKVDWWRTSIEKHGFTGFGHFNATYWPATHWMPLPATPTEEASK